MSRGTLRLKVSRTRTVEETIEIEIDVVEWEGINPQCPDPIGMDNDCLDEYLCLAKSGFHYEVDEEVEYAEIKGISLM